ncbi:MAG TPA: hypothetical protein VGO61_04530 [Steroidobacteraceae bacterium]|jgi:hypothetical protein|nr:hypothetical protein [Steroidobacteraceae bacterium]
MKIEIDISIFTSSDGAFGSATGSIELEVVPQVGDTISFVFPKAPGVLPLAGFAGLLRVTDRVFSAGGGSKISLALEDITVPNADAARAVAEYLDKGFGLGVDTY